MVDLLSMFRRRPVKRGRSGFARPRDDITAVEDPLTVLASTVNDAPIAHKASVSRVGVARQPPPSADLPRDLPRDLPKDLTKDVPRAEKPRPPRPKLANAAQPGKRSAPAGPQLMRRPGLLAVHSVERALAPARSCEVSASMYVAAKRSACWARMALERPRSST